MERVHWSRKQTDIPKRKKKRSLPFEKIEVRKLHFSRRFFVIVFFFFFVFFLFLVTSFLFRGDFFQISDFEVYGIDQLPEETIVSVLADYSDKNIFLQSTDEIKQSITAKSIFLKDIYVEKIFPDTISVYVVERYPRVVLVNLHGAYLIDQENIVIKILSRTDGYNLNPDEVDMLLGYTAEESVLVRNKIYESLGEEEKKEFKFEEVEEELKKNTYMEILSALDQKVNELITQNSKGVSATEFANLNRVMMYSNGDLQIGDSVKTKFTDVALEVQAYFRTKEEYTLDKLIWENDYALMVFTQEGKRFLFSDRREIWKQSEDLDQILSYLDESGEEFTQIDVTTSVVSVK